MSAGFDVNNSLTEPFRIFISGFDFSMTDSSLVDNKRQEVERACTSFSNLKLVDSPEMLVKSFLPHIHARSKEKSLPGVRRESSKPPQGNKPRILARRQVQDALRPESTARARLLTRQAPLKNSNSD